MSFKTITLKKPIIYRQFCKAEHQRHPFFKSNIILPDNRTQTLCSKFQDVCSLQTERDLLLWSADGPACGWYGTSLSKTGTLTGAKFTSQSDQMFTGEPRLSLKCIVH